MLLSVPGHIGAANEALEPATTVAPGAWVRMGVTVEAPVDAAASVTVPPGWSVVVPPKLGASEASGSVRATAVIDVPDAARAGHHAVHWQVGDENRVVTVAVAARHALTWQTSQTGAAAPTPREWWIGAPWSQALWLQLRGNMPLEVSVHVAAPSGFEVQWSPSTAQLAPGDVKPVEVTLTPGRETRLWPGQRIGLTLTAVDAAGATLATERISLRAVGQPAPLTDTDWRVDVHQRLTLVNRPTWQLDGVDTGVTGSGHLDAEKRQKLSFAVHTEPRRGRWLAFDGPSLHWRVGAQVVHGPPLGMAPQLGRGATLRWLVDHDRWAPLDGWRAVTASTARGRYQGASVDWSMGSGSGSLGLWSRRARGAVDPTRLNDRWWRGMHRFEWDSGGELSVAAGRHAGRWAGVVDGRWAFAHTRVRIRGEWRPPGYPSGEPTGARWGWSVVHQRPGGPRWSGRVQWAQSPAGGTTHRSAQAAIRVPISPRLAGQVGGMASTLGGAMAQQRAWLGWRARVGRWRWHARVPTRGRLQTQVVWQGPAGRRAHVRYRRRRGWDWGVAVRWGQRWRLSAGQRAARGVRRWVADVSGPVLARQSGVGRLYAHTTLSWHHPQGHHWQVSVERGPQSVEPTADAMRWRVAYRWRHRWQQPAWVSAPKASLAGRVLIHSDGGPRGLAGALVQLGDHTARTDAEGRYRFDRLKPGQHRVRLSPASVDGAWLAAAGWQRKVTVRVDETRRLDWKLVQAGRLQGHIAWPEQSSHAPPFADPAMRVSLACLDCPPGTPARVIPIQPDGGFDSPPLHPGRWRGQVMGALPAHHHWPEPAQIKIRSGLSDEVVWSVAYRPPSIRWAPPVSVETPRQGP